MSAWKPQSAAGRVQLWRSFYRKENPRALIGFFYGSEFPAIRYRAAASLPEDRPLVPEDFRVADYLADYERLYHEMEACPGDFLFSASAFWGIPWLEAASGCPIRVNHQTGSLYAQPPADFRGPESLPRFDPESPWIQKMFEFVEGVSAQAAGRYPVGSTRLRGIADLLAALYGGEDFVFKMMEEPGEIHEVCAALTQFYIAFARAQMERIPPFLGGVGSFYYHAWAPAGTVWHQEDSVMLLSPELYERFIAPCDRAIFEAFGGNIMHFHSTGGYLPLDEVLALGPTAVEMHIDSGGPSAQQLVGYHRKILGRCPLIVWGAMTERDIEWLLTALPKAGLALDIAVESVDQARGILERFGDLL